MRTKSNLLLLFILFTVNITLAQTVPEGFSTFPAEATINNSTSVTSEVGSALAGDKSVHVAYISRPASAAPQLKYFRYKDNAISNHVTIDLPGTPGQILGPVVALDQSSNPHIVVIVKRVVESNIRSGNYAIYYAGSADGGNSFTVSQVSTNPTDPNTDDENVFNCYVNGRPKIRVIDNVPWIYYFSDHEASKNYAILAKKNGSTWDRFKEFTFDQTDFNEPSIDFDAHFIHTDLGEIFGWNDYSDYTPKYAIKSGGNWQVTNMTEYDGTFGTRSVSMATTSDGEKHMMFMNEVDDEKFIHIKINGVGDYQEVNRLVLDFSKGGNVFPSTIDPVTKTPYFFVKKSFSNSGFLLTVDSEGQQLSNEFINVGNAPGVYTLHANNGYVSLVTADFDGDKIYISTGSVGGGGSSTALTSDFTGTPTSVAPGGEVTFSFTGTGTPATYAWTFEGGTPATSTAASPVVTYATAGQYKVTLGVTGEGGTSATKTKEAFITVEAGGSSNELKAIFTASSQNIAPGEKVKFTDTSTGAPASWSWTFEGGTPATSTLQSPEITYNAIGEYDVQLIVVKGTEKDTALLANHIKVTEGGSNGGADVTQITELWAKHIPMENNDEIVDIAVDAQGNIYATGFASRRVDDRRVTDVVVTSADKNGNERYYKTVVNNGGWSRPEDKPWTIAVDGSGNAYVAAGLDRYLGGVSGSIAQEHNLLSFDAQGTERWRVMTDAKHDYSQYMVVANDKVTLLIDGDAPSGPSISIAHAISYATATGSEVANSTVDLGQGNIAIGLYVDMYGYFRTERRLIQHDGKIIYGVTHAGTGANGRDIHLRSVSSTGQVLSLKIDSDKSFSQDELISLLADTNGNIYVLARLADAGHSAIMSLLKLSPQLTKLWQADVVPDGNSMAVTSMSFDSQGNIVISGAETQPRVAKVSPAGQLIWSKHLKALDSYFWRAHTVYVSPNDKIILAGSSGVASGSMSFILLDKDGNVTETYKNDYQGAEYENFFNKTVYIPSENAVYVGGWARTNGSNDKSLYYGKYAFPLKSSQTITFAALADVPQTTTEVPLSATASSGLAITYSVTGPATLSTNKLLITGPGKVAVTAKQVGNSGYSAAADVSQSFCVIASKPTISVSEQSDGVLLTSSAATGNQWYKNGTAITGATEKTYLAVASADYSVRVLVDECEGTLSDVEEVVVSPTLGLPDVSENRYLKVYPNPVSGVFTVESGNRATIGSVDVFSVSGKRLKSVPPMQQASGKLEVNISELPKGVYMLMISSDGKNYAMRILKE